METTAMRCMYKQETKDSSDNVGTKEVKAKKSPELVIAYLKGEPVVGIFGQETKEVESPLTKEFDYPTFNFNNRTKHVGRIIKDTGSPLYCHSWDLWIRAKTSISQKLEHQTTTETKKSLEELIPEQYQKFWKVFKKVASERFPDERPWDHAIDLKPDFVPKDCKVYPLTPTK